jgi:tetratricopeptide (TPR) repeat protein
MTFVRCIWGLLCLRDESLRLLAASRNPVLPLGVFVAGFVVFGLVRQAVYAGLREPQAAAGPLGYLVRLNIFSALVYFAVLLVPLLISLSNALAGDGLGFTVSRREYAAWRAALLPLWGTLFLLAAPVQWLLPHFLVLGDFGISIGLLVLSSLMVFYTIWGAGRLAGISPAIAAAVVVLACLTLPVFSLLSSRPYASLLLLCAAAIIWLSGWVRKRSAASRVERMLEQRIAAMEVKLQDAEAQHRVGLMQVQLGRLDAAAASLERALSIQPGVPEHEYDLGRVHESRGDWQAALAHYENARSLAPDCCQGKVLREVGKASFHTGDTEKALELLRSFLGGHASDPEARYWLAAALERNDCAEEMRIQLHTLLEQARSSPRLSRTVHREWVLRARALIRSGSP